MFGILRNGKINQAGKISDSSQFNLSCQDCTALADEKLQLGEINCHQWFAGQRFSRGADEKTSVSVHWRINALANLRLLNASSSFSFFDSVEKVSKYFATFL